MTATPYRLLAAALLLAGLLPVSPARSAESYDACTGFIDSVPATITTQGVWCLRKDLSTNIASGSAIAISVNNVTVDCNGFKLGGLAAGNGSVANGIYAVIRQNATVRNCNIRGFFTGIELIGGAGHLVEDNRLDNNLAYGIAVTGTNNRIRRNAVYDTGGQTAAGYAYGILGNADIVDNTVSGLYSRIPNGNLTGIYASGTGAQARNNTVSGFDMTATEGGSVAAAYGLYLSGYRARASGNHVDSLESGTAGHGIFVPAVAYCMDNTVGGFATAIHANCIDGGNLTSP